MENLNPLGFMTLFVVVGFLGGCEEEQMVCTADLRFGVVVDVDGGVESGNCKYVVTATDGTYVEELDCLVYEDEDNATCRCYGAGEREGTYLVEVSSEDEVVASRQVTVTGDQCHVDPQHLSFSVP